MSPYSVTTRHLGPNVVRHALLRDGAPLARRDALLGGGAPFVASFVDLLRSGAPWPAYCVELPPIALDALDRPFEVVLVDSPALARTVADLSAFAAHLGDGDTAVFDNLSGDARLVAPTRADDDCAHIAAFTRTARVERQRALWTAVGDAARDLLGAEPRWISTAGLGVPWLHVRLDRQPKYYRFGPFRDRRA